MSGLVRGFQEAYLTADRRVLGLFRILFGTVLFYDLGRRALDLRLLYSNDGVLSNHFLLFAPQARPQFSVYSIFSTPAEVALGFAFTALVYGAYTIGLYTRLAQLGALVCLTSLNARNLFFEDGGMSTMILLAVWTAFLPLGDRCSIDALRREAALPNLKARVKRRAELEAPFVSLAMLAILLQIAVIYWLNAAHKTGATWKHGDAIHLVLWQNRVATPLAHFIAQHEPAWFSPLSTRATIAIEALMVPLVLIPFQRRVLRTIAFLLAILLHGSIALLMSLGPFSYAMIALVSLALPPEALAAIAGRLPRRALMAVAGWRGKVVRYIAELRQPSLMRLRASPARAGVTRATGALREAVVVLVMVAATVQVTQNNRAISRRFRLQQPKPLESFIGYTRMIQSWNMFAPDAPEEDGTVVLDARTEDGRHIDPFTGAPPDFEVARRGPVPHSVMLSDYLFAMHLPNNKQYQGELRNWLSRFHLVAGRTAADRIVSYEVWWVSHRSPARGSTTPSEFKQDLILRGP